jgi:hypothetical protein
MPETRLQQTGALGGWWALAIFMGLLGLMTLAITLLILLPTNR